MSAKVSDHDPNIKRPDPKDRIEFYQQFQNAYNWFTSGAKEEALKTMLGLESSMSDSPQFYSEWAYFQTGAEKWQEAERSYLRCLELDPDYPEAALNLSAVSIKLEKFQQGMDRLKILLAKEPENGLAHLYAGFCAKELDQPKVAIEHWSQFVDLLPGHPDAPKIRAAIGR